MITISSRYLAMPNFRFRLFLWFSLRKTLWTLREIKGVFHAKAQSKKRRDRKATCY